MDYLGYLAACIVGLGLGLHFGRLLTAIIAYWESTGAAAKAYISVIGFALGSGGGVVIFRLFSGSHVTFYLIGLGLGIVTAFVWPRIPARYTLENITLITRMSEALRVNVPKIRERALLILAALTPPKSISREERISKKELAEKLEEAADAFQGEEGQCADGSNGQR